MEKEFIKKRIGKTINEYDGILLHIPHSSTSFPDGLHYSFQDLDGEEIDTLLDGGHVLLVAVFRKPLCIEDFREFVFA